MSGGVVKKCVYFNSGYCRYTKKEMGCNNLHPKDVCELQGCREKSCLNSHPKKCKFGDECWFQSSCSYSHGNKKFHTEEQKYKWVNLKKEIENLKKEIDNL